VCLLGVSIPYRYDKNIDTPGISGSTYFLFQFLIGTIKTGASGGMRAFATEVFQFLIGTIKT